MQNATLRYNITFGCPYVEGVYDKVKVFSINFFHNFLPKQWNIS